MHIALSLWMDIRCPTGTDRPAVTLFGAIYKYYAADGYLSSTRPDSVERQSAHLL